MLRIVYHGLASLKGLSALTGDIGPILNDWPYESGKLNVRLITLPDGESRIQVRLDLGLLQMHTEGRPDGQKPEGFDSLLEMLEHQQDLTEQGELDASEDPDDADEPGESTTPEKPRRGRAGPSAGDAPNVANDAGHAEDGAEERAPSPTKFTLNPEQCQALRDEAVQYYHRYMALMALEDYEGVVRDTTRNLRVLDLCANFAETDQDREALEQYRPYITMVRTRAIASQALKDNEPKAAIFAIDDGLEQLKKYFAEAGESDGFDQSTEVQMLRGMREALVPKLPVSQKSELKQRLQLAVEQENYKLAAILRDELRMIDKEGA